MCSHWKLMSLHGSNRDMVATVHSRFGERALSYNSHALQETGIFGDGFRSREFGRGTKLAALIHGARSEDHAFAGRAPIVDHQMPVAGEANLQDLIGDFPAITFERHGAITHGYCCYRTP